MRKQGKAVLGLQSTQFILPQIGKRKSFAKAEEAARAVLRERGLTEAQIDIELKRAKRSRVD